MNFNDVFARITRRVFYLHFLIANPDSCCLMKSTFKFLVRILIRLVVSHKMKNEKKQKEFFSLFFFLPPLQEASETTKQMCPVEGFFFLYFLNKWWHPPFGRINKRVGTE